MRLAPLVLLAALTVGCTSSPTPATPPPTTTMSAAEKAEREAATEATKQLLKDMNKTTTSARPAGLGRPSPGLPMSGDDLTKLGCALTLLPAVVLWLLFVGGCAYILWPSGG